MTVERKAFFTRVQVRWAPPASLSLVPWFVQMRNRRTEALKRGHRVHGPPNGPSSLDCTKPHLSGDMKN